MHAKGSAPDATSSRIYVPTLDRLRAISKDLHMPIPKLIDEMVSTWEAAQALPVPTPCDEPHMGNHRCDEPCPDESAHCESCEDMREAFHSGGHVWDSWA